MDYKLYEEDGLWVIYFPKFCVLATLHEEMLEAGYDVKMSTMGDGTVVWLPVEPSKSDIPKIVKVLTDHDPNKPVEVKELSLQERIDLIQDDNLRAILKELTDV